MDNVKQKPRRITKADKAKARASFARYLSKTLFGTGKSLKWLSENTNAHVSYKPKPNLFLAAYTTAMLLGREEDLLIWLHNIIQPWEGAHEKETQHRLAKILFRASISSDPENVLIEAYHYSKKLRPPKDKWWRP